MCDPIALEAKMIIDASGHDSVAVKRLVDRNMVEWKGMDPMWVENGEEHVVEKTGEVFPGLVAAACQLLKHMDWHEWDRLLVLCYILEKRQLRLLTKK